MGGRALKTAFTRRYEKAEFLALKDEVVKILDKEFEYKTVPLYYRDKESFGDLDVVIAWEPGQCDDGNAIRAYIESTFKPTEIFHNSNSNSWSFDYKECQVDFIMCPKADFWCYYHYFAYNDLGNFIGVLARNIGLKYGQEGLFYDHYFKEKNVGRIIVSKTYPEIFKFLDLDYLMFMRGFNNLEEIFAFITTSKYYNGEFFQLSALNKINRERNLKRTSYMAMLDYIETNPKESSFQYVEDKTPYIKMANDFFPEFNYKEETRRLEYEMCRELYVKSKFSGDMVREKYGLTGEELGTAMGEFKAHYKTKEGYTQFILETPTNLIYRAFEGLTLLF